MRAMSEDRNGHGTARRILPLDSVMMKERMPIVVMHVRVRDVSLPDLEKQRLAWVAVICVRSRKTSALEMMRV